MEEVNEEDDDDLVHRPDLSDADDDNNFDFDENDNDDMDEEEYG